ncbi:hypothetical protein J6590_020352 [Homalodisca vitripennis]|nr:hypothetical protein J6590_020352 [Homalodisca vitripennis]
MVELAVEEIAREKEIGRQARGRLAATVLPPDSAAQCSRASPAHTAVPVGRGRGGVGGRFRAHPSADGDPRTSRVVWWLIKQHTNTHSPATPPPAGSHFLIALKNRLISVKKLGIGPVCTARRVSLR